VLHRSHFCKYGKFSKHTQFHLLPMNKLESDEPFRDEVSQFLDMAQLRDGKTLRYTDVLALLMKLMYQLNENQTISPVQTSTANRSRMWTNPHPEDDETHHLYKENGSQSNTPVWTHIETSTLVKQSPGLVLQAHNTNVSNCFRTATCPLCTRIRQQTHGRYILSADVEEMVSMENILKQIFPIDVGLIMVSFLPYTLRLLPLLQEGPILREGRRYSHAQALRLRYGFDMVSARSANCPTGSFSYDHPDPTFNHRLSACLKSPTTIAAIASVDNISTNWYRLLSLRGKVDANSLFATAVGLLEQNLF
jgi:hypothetical protein